MSSFTVKSSIHDYEVRIVDDLDQALSLNMFEDDFVIYDHNVKRHYQKHLDPILVKHRSLGIDATEHQKSYQGIIPVLHYLIEHGFRKNHRLVAIGGGITQDVTAFIASIMYRGVNWAFFPTTLLAQGDSCIGSKTSINFGEYKNQVGGFYPPNIILIYPPFIDTLEEADMKSGMGEMLHYFLVAGQDDFLMYKNLYRQAFHDKKALTKIISRSLEIKKSYIEVDEFDRNVRQVFNYGHSFGHAIESLSNYRVPHGIAVCFGMDIANFISVKMGFLTENIRWEIRDVTEALWADHFIKNIDVGLFLKALSKDKKNIGTKLGLILNKGYGKIFKHVMDVDEEFISWIREYFHKEAA